ncbi:ribosomal subunit interface protein, partial [Salmonella enterica subsp. enterica serovar Typhi]|nr:ribosomal subunit interface protein [Salmonella enterica subsp. enterica serovar Typhi]
RKHREKGNLNELFGSYESVPSGEDEEQELEIVRQKRFNLKPMDSEEAILQMDLLGHNFFVYTDAETNNTNIVYKRKDGKYGLIEAQ